MDNLNYLNRSTKYINPEVVFSINYEKRLLRYFRTRKVFELFFLLGNLGNTDRKCP